MSATTLVTSTAKSLSPQGIANRRLVAGDPGTVLFAMYASVGAVSTLGVPAVWNQALLGIAPIEGLADPRFVAYWLRHYAPRAVADARSATQANLNAEQVANFPFADFGVEEQRRIADFLDDRVSRIDRIIAARREQMHLLDEASHTKIDTLFQRNGDEQATRLARYVRVQSGLTVDAGRQVDGRVLTRPYLRVANVHAGRLNLTEISTVAVAPETAARSTLRPGDVLMTEGGDIDKLGRGTVWSGEIADCLHQNHVFAVRPDQSRLLSRFLALYTRTSAARAYFEATGVRSTNLASTSSAKVMSLPIPIRSAEDQARAIAKYDAFAEQDAETRGALARQVELLTEYKSSLITAAVTGELDVTTAGSNIPG